MPAPFPPHFKEIADDMGISLYSKFSLSEAALFLRIPIDELKQLVKKAKIDCISLTPKNIQFFGYQLLHYLLDNVTQHQATSKNQASTPDRIIRAKEVYEMTSLSRTTIWRYEKVGKFPKRIALGDVSVGWKLSEVQEWIENK